MVKALLRNGKAMIFSRQSSILSAATVLMMMALLSALLSFVRWRVLFTYFGNSSDLGIYLLADRIPNFIFNILVSGALASVFIPVFIQWRRKDEKEAWQLTSTLFYFLCGIFSLVLLTLYILATPVSRLISVSQLSPEQLQLMVGLLRIMLLAQMILVVSAFMTAFLHSFQHFFVPALAPVFYWMGSIVFMILFVDWFGIFAAAYGMLLGSLLHLLLQIPLARKLGFRFAPNIDLQGTGFKQVLRLMLPRVLGQVAPEVSRLVEASLAVTVSIFSTALLTAAQTLYFFPITIFAVAIAQAAFPFLAEKAQENNLGEFQKTFVASFHQILFFMVPMAFLLVVLRLPAVRLVFGSDEFRWESTVLTGATLALLCLGMLAQALIHLLVRSFYALQDTLTPLWVGILMTALYISLGALLLLNFHVPVWGLALSYAVATNLQALLLLGLLLRKMKNFSVRSFFSPIVRMLTAGVVTGALTYMVFKLLDRYSWGQGLSLGRIQLPTTLYNMVVDTSYTLNLVYFTVLIGLFGLGVYLLLSYLMGVTEVRLVLNLVRRGARVIKR